VANDPCKAYQVLVGDDGKWVVREDVRIRYISRARAARSAFAPREAPDR
jgi:hypothetical protein